MFLLYNFFSDYPFKCFQRSWQKLIRSFVLSLFCSFAHSLFCSFAHMLFHSFALEKFVFFECFWAIRYRRNLQKSDRERFALFHEQIALLLTKNDRIARKKNCNYFANFAVKRYIFKTLSFYLTSFSPWFFAPNELELWKNGVDNFVKLSH